LGIEREESINNQSSSIIIPKYAHLSLETQKLDSEVSSEITNIPKKKNPALNILF